MTNGQEAREGLFRVKALEAYASGAGAGPVEQQWHAIPSRASLAAFAAAGLVLAWALTADVPRAATVQASVAGRAGDALVVRPAAPLPAGQVFVVLPGGGRPARVEHGPDETRLVFASAPEAGSTVVVSYAAGSDNMAKAGLRYLFT